MNRKGKEMFKDKISKELVRERMAYPYEIKVRMTERRLSEFITYYGESGVAVSISGGLDSTAAMHFIHKCFIPCICWQEQADEVAGWQQGDTVELLGRYQSRQYEKVIDTDSGSREWRTAYEISVQLINRKGLAGNES